MAHSAKIQYAIDVFTQVMARKNRLANGLKDRKRLRDANLAGQDITGDPRYRFIVDSAQMMIDFLHDIASQFDRDHPEDQCSNLDILDILKIVEAKFSGLSVKKDGT